MQEQVIQGYRLSPQQKRLWQLQQSNDARAFCAQCALLISGPLNAKALAAALEDVVERHQILRTTFHCFYGMTIPVQVVTEVAPQVDAEYDLRHLSQVEQRERIEEILREARQALFDCERGPVLKMSRLRLSGDTHMLIFTLPALCADAIGLRNMVREISRSYAAAVTGEAHVEEPMQYIIASEWQNDLFETDDFEIGKSFWRKQGLSALNALRLPYGKQSLPEQNFEPACVEFKIEDGGYAQIEAVANRYRASASEFLLTCWHILLGRVTGQSEVIVGTGYDGRTDEAMEEAPGLFVKYLPIRSDMDERLTFSALLEQLTARVWEAYEWQEWFTLEEEPTDSACRLFPICFDFEQEFNGYEVAEVKFSIYRHYVCTDRFELKLSCVGTPEGVSARLYYNSSLFTADEAEELAKLYQALVQSAIRKPDETLGNLDLLSDEAKRRLIADFNDTFSESPQNQCIHDLFEAQVERTPDTIAIVYEDESLTYAGLNKRANQLARYIVKRGAGREAFVAICLERSADIVTGVLGVLKAGAAYVPIDPSYPAERAAFVLNDASAAILLTQEKLLENFAGQAIEKVCLDADGEAICRESDADFDSGAVAENAAYVIYTSGSTGRPKGVMIEHRSPINLLTALKRMAYDDLHGSALRVSLNAPLAFDASVQQLIMLMRGDTIEIIPQAIRTDGKSLLAHLLARQVEVFDCTPSQLEILLGAGLLQSRLSCLRAVLVAGEAIDERMWQDLAASARPTFYNIYGPTECTVDATFCRVRDVQDKPSIGLPLANYRVHLLDAMPRLAPIGASGELYVGGSGLARGYLNRPALTAERFVPDPFSQTMGARLYKTGDVGRRMPGGRIEFLGRADHQVKIRGYRIELGEIESVLAQHPAVRSVAVITKKDAAVGDQIFAYVASDDAEAGLAAKLREYAEKRLPDYMLPSAFFMLEAMPLTASGKIDRLALPAPERLRQSAEAKLTPPQTHVEEIVAGVWVHALGADRVGRESNFFSLGGHSLLATQVINQLRKTFGVEIPLVSLFESPTVASLAERIEAAMKSGNGSSAPVLRPRARGATAPLSYEQRRMWTLERMMPGGSGTYVSGLWTVEGHNVSPAALEQSLGEIVRRHEALRTVFTAEGGEPVQIVVQAGAMRLAIVDLSALNEKDRKREVGRLSRADMVRPFVLDRSLMLRAALISCGAGPRFVQYTMHHIVADVVSMNIVEQELTALLEHYPDGRPSPLEELPFQYADYALWQQEYAGGAWLKDHLAYWRAQLAGASRELALPMDRPRPSTPTFRGAWQRLLLSRTLTNSLAALSAQEGVTLFMTLLAALQTLLCRLCGQEDICVGSPVTFRERMQVEKLIGYFTNILVLRADLSGNPSFRELLKRVRQMTLGAYAHQDLPFEVLVDDLQADRNTSVTPLFQVWYNFPKLNEARLADQGDEFTTGLLDEDAQENNWAPYDLTVLVTDLAAGLQIGVEYHKDIFDSATIRSMLNDFEVLIEQVVANPDQRILDIPLCIRIAVS